MNNKSESKHAEVFHFDLYGKREDKYEFLLQKTLDTINWNKLEPDEPNYFFVSKDFDEKLIYDYGFSVNELFTLNSLGLLTKRDDLSIDFEEKNLEDKISYFLDETNPLDEVCRKFNLVVKDNDKWDANQTRKKVSKSSIKEQIKKIQYRPFDNRIVFYNSYFVARPNTKILGHLIKRNIGLIICRQGQAVGGNEWNVVFISRYLTDQNIYRRGGGTVFPLYLYPDSNGQENMELTTPAPPEEGNKTMKRVPNLNLKIVQQIAAGLGLEFVAEKEEGELKTPLNLPKGETLRPNSGQSPSFGGVGEVGLGEAGEVGLGEAGEFKTPLNLPKGETLRPKSGLSPSFGGVGEVGLENVGEFKTPLNLPKGETLRPNSGQSPSFGEVGEVGLENAGEFKTPLNLPKGETLRPKSGLSPSFGGVGEVGLENVGEFKTPLNLPKGETLRPNSGQSPSFGGVGEVGLGEAGEVGLNDSRPGYITANPKHYILIKDMRKSLKDNPTEAEKLIWEYLKTKKTGYKIRRQHVIDNFITDFVCLSKKVVIEIDGKIHLQQKEYDELRTAKLNELQYEIIRFTNEEVFANPELVALKIKEKLDSKADLQSDELSSIISEGDGPGNSTFAPIDILDYIYAVLHSPAYREKYKEFLKIDFPRVPFPTDSEKFWQLVKLGGEIRELHLLESKIFDNINLNFPIEGSGEVTRKMTSKSIGFELTDKENSLGKVWINDLQYFGDVPLIAWEFYIGGYQPAQKWLKDRHGRTLGYDDVQHYRKIIIALTETARLMQEIDVVGVE
jgi:very-short-patch-repair endonuclease